MSDFEVCPVGTQARLAQAEAERDALRETERKFGTMMHAVMAERDELLDEISALREVLLYSLDNQGRYRKKHQKIVDAAIAKAGGGNG